MNGLTLLRKHLNMTGEEFGKKLNVSKATISEWEAQKRKIPEKKKQEIGIMYGCSVEYLDHDLNELEQIYFLQKLATKPKENISKNSVKTIAEENISGKPKGFEEWHKARIDKISAKMNNDGIFLDWVERLSIIADSPQGTSIINILLTAAEQYYDISDEWRIRGEDSRYAIGMINMDDDAVAIIESALRLALKR